MKKPASAIKIEKDVPVSPGRSRANAFVATFEAMEVGDSFVISLKEAANLRTSLSQYIKRKRSDRKFTTRSRDEGLRVWRIK